MTPRRRLLEAVASGDLTHDAMSFEIQEVRVRGDVAVVIARGQSSGTFKGETFQLDEWTTDVFVRRDEQWKCMVTHLTSASTPDPA